MTPTNLELISQVARLDLYPQTSRKGGGDRLFFDSTSPVMLTGVLIFTHVFGVSLNIFRSVLMKTKKKIFAFLLLGGLLLSACSSASPASAPAVSSSEPTAEEVAPTEIFATETPDLSTPPEPPAAIQANPSQTVTPFVPMQLTDSVGNELTLEEPPLRIISLAPSITETLYAIGAGELLVGRTDFDNYPEEVTELPSVGGFSADSISVETILELEPDLVLGGSVWQADLVSTLNESGIPSLTFEPKNFAEIMDLMLLLGDATQHAEDAAAAVDAMNARVDTVASVVETIPQSERLSVFYEVWNEPLMTASDQSFIGEIIARAGGKNIFANLEDAYPTVSAEEVLSANPDVILGPSSHGDQLTAETIAAREGWASLSAVQNNAVYLIDADMISRAGPRVVDALEAVAQVLYPAYFESVY